RRSFVSRVCNERSQRRWRIATARNFDASCASDMIRRGRGAARRRSNRRGGIKMRTRLLTLVLLVVPGMVADGQPAGTPPVEQGAPAVSASRVTGVTVYQGTALVRRDVDVKEGAGLVELVVSPLPPETI